MASIDIDHVTEFFTRICGISSAAGYTDLISRAAVRIINSLTVTELSPGQAVCCAYAAACEAAYEYALEEASHERPVMSETGRVMKRSAEAVTVEMADKLRKHAFGQLAGIIKAGGFVFEAMEG